MSAFDTPAWVDANQRLMTAELRRLKARLGDHGAVESDASVDSAIGSELARARAAMPAPAAIDRLADAFAMTPFERDVLLLCAGVEMDSALAAKCDGAAVTFGLALATLEAPHWSALAPVGPLRRWRLIEMDEAAGVTRGRLRIDERILHFLAGVNYLDVRLASLLRPVATPTAMAESHRRLCAAVLADLETADANYAPLVWLTGADALGQADIAANVAASLGRSLHVLQATDVPAGHAESDALGTLWEREATLLASTLLVRAGDDTLTTSAVRFIEALGGLVFVSAAQPQPLERDALRFSVNKAAPSEQRQLWIESLGAHAAHVEGALDALASQFRLSARTIEIQAQRLAPTLGESERPDQAMWAACRTLGRSRLDDLAQRVETRASWSDLVLPEPQKDTLRQIAAHMRNRLQVNEAWGFAEGDARGAGISVLFAGESGTGKTMAAEVLARELRLDLYRIDLSAVVSKYIGETEKNLRRVFDAAEDSGAILLFDEADALFGKRSEVKDSHDRYANIEVSYLLQRMETYRGLAILTTNLKAALDSAFQRRLRFVVQFPFPDHALREVIWRGVFPPRTPTADIDSGKLARLSATGGSIRNIARNAAFRAVECNEPVSMSHVLHAAHHEASKRERPLSDAETRGWT